MDGQPPRETAPRRVFSKAGSNVVESAAILLGFGAEAARAIAGEVAAHAWSAADRIALPDINGHR